MVYQENDWMGSDSSKNIQKAIENINLVINDWKKSQIKNKPNRDTVINSDDIINLGIALGACKSFDEFLAVI